MNQEQMFREEKIGKFIRLTVGELRKKLKGRTDQVAKILLKASEGKPDGKFVSVQSSDLKNSAATSQNNKPADTDGGSGDPSPNTNRKRTKKT